MNTDKGATLNEYSIHNTAQLSKDLKDLLQPAKLSFGLGQASAATRGHRVIPPHRLQD